MDGYLKVEASTDFPERFAPGSVLYLGDQPTVVQRSRSTKGRVVVKLDVVDDRTQAESLRGRLLTVPPDQLKPLGEGSYYHFQIIGIGVWSDQGEFLGTLTQILSTGSNDVYVVTGDSRKELLLPAIAESILEVDLRENRMTVRVPEGLG